MKLGKMIKTGILLGTLGSQSVLAGQPYVFGNLPKVNMPQDFKALIVPSYNETTKQILQNEVYVVPTANFKFNLVNTPNPVLMDAPAEFMCESLRAKTKMVRGINDMIARIQEKIDEAIFDDTIDVAKYEAALEKYEAKLELKGAELAKLSKTPALEINGTWDDGFEALHDKLLAQNPGLTIRRPVTRINKIFPSGAVNSNAPVFSNLEINGQVWNNASKGNVQTFESKVEFGQKTVTQGLNGEEGASLTKAVVSSAQEGFFDPAMNGVYSATLSLSSACPYFEASNSYDALGSLSFQVIRSFSSVRMIKAKARYNAKKVYNYFKEVSEGPAKGWQVWKREVNQKIKKNTGVHQDFYFEFNCQDYYPQGNCEELNEKIEDKLRNHLIDEAAKSFLAFKIDADTPDTLPMPDNKFGDAMGIIGTATMGPKAGVIMKTVGDLFSSTASRVQYEQTLEVTVEEKWTDISSTPIYSSQSGSVNFVVE